MHSTKDSSNGHEQVMLNGKPVEIERKYIIDIPDENTMSILRSCEGYERSYIEQMYLNCGGRIRKRAYFSDDADNFPDRIKYFHTIKQDINGLSRYELEREISCEEYNRLSEDILNGSRVIKKLRYCFLYKSQLFELDVYELTDSFASLEIELKSEDQSVELPDFLHIIEDVTGDKRYRNFSLAVIK